MGTLPSPKEEIRRIWSAEMSCPVSPLCTVQVQLAVLPWGALSS